MVVSQSMTQDEAIEKLTFRQYKPREEKLSLPKRKVKHMNLPR